MSKMQRHQQAALWEFVHTELSYINKLIIIKDVRSGFLTCCHSQISLHACQCWRGIFHRMFVTKMCLPLAVGDCSSSQPTSAWISPGGQCAEHAAPFLQWKHNKHNLSRPIFHCSAYHWNTLTDITRTWTSAQDYTEYKTDKRKM